MTWHGMVIRCVALRCVRCAPGSSFHFCLLLYHNILHCRVLYSSRSHSDRPTLVSVVTLSLSSHESNNHNNNNNNNNNYNYNYHYTIEQYISIPVATIQTVAGGKETIQEE
mmetsp:Transcript_28830/g.33051  ORF Transcript_28830/g.33051 Transcript_28830/m.33051 type:complete len:111 (-) Transcript_28830:69-401(-)